MVYFLAPELVYLVQDVNDVLAAIDHIIDKRLASSSRIAVIGGSHGGFLTTHLIGQVLWTRFVFHCPIDIS